MLPTNTRRPQVCLLSWGLHLGSPEVWSPSEPTSGLPFVLKSSLPSRAPQLWSPSPNPSERSSEGGGLRPPAQTQPPGGVSRSWTSRRRPGSALSWKTFWLFVYISGAALPGNMAVTAGGDSGPARPLSPSVSRWTMLRGVWPPGKARFPKPVEGRGARGLGSTVRALLLNLPSGGGGDCWECWFLGKTCSRRSADKRGRPASAQPD